MSSGYELDPAEHEKIYSEIASRDLAMAEPRAYPVAVVTGGQPGSGKSGLTSRAKVELAEHGGFVLIDADVLRTSHPAYRRLLAENDREAANLTHPDAGRWAGRLYRDARDSRRNLIIDQTSRDADAALRLSAALREAGYVVDLRVMAVSERISEQRIHARYEGQKAKAGHGRFSTKDSHDGAYAGIPLTLESVERMKAVDKISLYDFELNRIYANHLEAGAWANPTAARTTLEAERIRPWTLEQKIEFAAGYQSIETLLKQPDRNASFAERTAVDQLLVRAMRERDAEAFRMLTPRQAVQINPELAGAFALAAALANQIKGVGGADIEQRVAMASMRERIASSIEQGRMPEIRIKTAHMGQERAAHYDPPER